MNSIAQVAAALEPLLTSRANELARETGFVQRESKVTGAVFAQTLVCGWMEQPEASYTDLRQVAATVRVQVSNQGLEERFGPASARFVRGLLQEAVGVVVSQEPSTVELLRRFNGVIVQDSTIISFPTALADEWQGCGGSTSESGASQLKVQARLNLSTGQLQGPWLQAGRSADASGEGDAAPWPPAAMRLTDLGYVTLQRLREQNQQGQHYVYQAKATVKVIDAAGCKWDLLRFLQHQGSERIDVQVRLGIKEQVSVRLLAVRVAPQEAKERRERARAASRTQAQATQDQPGAAAAGGLDRADHQCGR